MSFKLKLRLLLSCRHFGDTKSSQNYIETKKRQRKKKALNPNGYSIITLLCISLFPCSPLCSSCIASGATSLNTTKRTVWLPWQCPAWWSTPCSRCCRSVTTGTYTPLLTASPPSCRTTPWTGGCWGHSTWERDAVSSTGTTQITEILLAVGFIISFGQAVQCAGGDIGDTTGLILLKLGSIIILGTIVSHIKT